MILTQFLAATTKWNRYYRNGFCTSITLWCPGIIQLPPQSGMGAMCSIRSSVCLSHFGFPTLFMLTLELQSPNLVCSFSTLSARLSSKMGDHDLFPGTIYRCLLWSQSSNQNQVFSFPTMAARLISEMSELWFLGLFFTCAGPRVIKPGMQLLYHECQAKF